MHLKKIAPLAALMPPLLQIRTHGMRICAPASGSPPTPRHATDLAIAHQIEPGPSWRRQEEASTLGEGTREESTKASLPPPSHRRGPPAVCSGGGERTLAATARVPPVSPHRGAMFRSFTQHEGKGREGKGREGVGVPGGCSLLAKRPMKASASWLRAAATATMV
jgi:hypothetical protein